MLILQNVVLALLLVAFPVFAHTNQGITHQTWSFEPFVALPLFILFIAYFFGIYHLYTLKIYHRILNWKHVTTFLIGLWVLVMTLMSPLDTLADLSFSAHMTQHLMLMLVAPPLLVLGRIEIVLLWTFPISIRRLIGKTWNNAKQLRTVIDFLKRPITIWIFMSFSMWFWHIPGPYTWAYNNPNIHILEHLSFFLTSLAFWSLVMQPYRRNKGGHGTALLLLATFAIESSLLGALLAFSGHSYYSVHATVQSRYMLHSFYGITPLQDQQLAGLIMWVPASAVQLVALGTIFIDWLADIPKFSRTANL